MAKVNIMIVEDDAITAMDIENQLKNLGYSVSAKVANGEDAIQKAKENTPDLVLMDIVLKGEMDGIEAAEEIRTQFDIPVVFLTAYADKDRLERAKLSYPFGFIIKPFQDKDLQVTIEMALYVAKVDAERKQMEEALRDREARYRNLFENMLNGFAYCQMLYKDGRPDDFIYLDVNKTFGKLTGLRNVVGKKVTEVISGIKEETPELFDIYARVAETSSPEQFEIDFTPLDIWLNISVYSPQKGYFVAVFENITERKKAEEALAKSETFLNATGQIAKVGGWEIDGETKKVFWTKEIYNITEVPNDYDPSSLEKEAIVFFSEEDQIRLEKAIQRAFEHNEPYDMELQITTAKGNKKWVQAICEPFVADGKVVKLGGTFQDITEQKQAEEVLRKRAEEFAALYETSLDITKPHDLSSLLETIIGRATKLLNCPRGGMYLCDPDRKEVRCVVSYKTPDDYSGTVLKYGEGAAGIVAQTKKPLIIDDYRTWSKRATAYDKDQPFTAVISVPMIWQDDVIGVIHVLHDVETRHFTQSDLDLLTLFASQAATALNNAQLVEKVQSYAAELEKRITEIEEHTAELEKVNEQLKKEIKERKQAEEALRESEQRYRTLFEQNPNPIAIINAKGRYLDANPAFLKFVERTKENLLQMSVFDFTQSEKRISQESVHRPVWEIGGTLETEYFIDDKIKILELTITPISYKGIDAIFGVGKDITERKQAEEALRESEERYQLATKGGNVGVWDWNLTTGDMFVSPNLKAMLGYDDSEIKNHIEEWGKHVYAEDTEAVMKEANACIEGVKKDYHVEHRMVHKDGSIRWFLASGKVLRDESSKPIRFFGTDTDITKLKNLENQLRQAQKMEAIAVLAGGIAHQFNNALSPITANIDMLELDFPDEEKIATYTKQMKGSADRMTLLSDQLLAYARGGKYQGRILSVSDFMRDTLPLIKHTIDPAIQIDTDIPRDIFNIKADITQMQMVLSAILSNASEAIKGEGRIRITCKNEMIADERAKDFPGLKPDPYVKLKIEDDGKGMDEETKSRIFEPFFTTKFQGRGLGMAAAYGIIKNHDGWISVDSELGKGTTVRIFLPTIEAKVKELKKPKIEPAKGAGTILVIEDEEMIMDVTRTLLERLDYRVLGAKTGNEAINIVKTFDGDIDLAILDIVLPDMNGKSIYPSIMEARPNLKVLVCSGYSIDGPAQEILNAGAQDFIQKPFSMAKLSEKLKEVLEGK